MRGPLISEGKVRRRSTTSISSRFEASWTTRRAGAKEASDASARPSHRGIHPPALDIGLEGALSTLSARSATPTELSLQLHDRPTPAIEAICKLLCCRVARERGSTCQLCRERASAASSMAGG